MKLNFRKPVDSGGDFLYICPTIVPFIEKNPFTSQKRQLPVEFSYPYRYPKATPWRNCPNRNACPPATKASPARCSCSNRER